MQAHDLAANNDTILLIVIPATSCRDVAASKALKLAQELDSEGQWLFLFRFSNVLVKVSIFTYPSALVLEYLIFNYGLEDYSSFLQSHVNVGLPSNFSDMVQELEL